MPPHQVDFHAAVDRRIPSLVYCHLAGAPSTDAPRVQSLSERTLSLLARDRTLIPSILEAYDELFDYLADLIARKRADGSGRGHAVLPDRAHRCWEADRAGAVRRGDVHARGQLGEHRPPDRAGRVDAAGRPCHLAAAAGGSRADPRRRRGGDPALPPHGRAQQDRDGGHRRPRHDYPRGIRRARRGLVGEPRPGAIRRARGCSTWTASAISR